MRALLVALALVPLLAGCPSDPPRPPNPDQAVVQEAWVVPDAAVLMEGPFGHVRVAGRALAVPVTYHGTPVGAVYFGAQLSWRTDAIFHAKTREPVGGNLFVQAPAGQWEGLRARQNWTGPATAADIAAAGIAGGAPQAFRAAASLLPNQATPPQAGHWAFNGTFAGRLDPLNLTVTDGGYIYNRNASGYIVLDGGSILTWSQANHTLIGNNDGVFTVRILDPALAQVREGRWNASSIEVQVTSPHFRPSDLRVGEAADGDIVSIVHPNVVEIGMVHVREKSVQEDRAVLRGRNVTVTLSPA